MRVYRVIIVAICLVAISLSCRRTGREVVEKVSIEVAEKSAKNIAEEGVEKSLKSLTKSELRDMDWNDLLKMIKSENLNLEQSLKSLDNSFQKQIGKAITTDYECYSALISSNRMIDEFSDFAKNSPQVAKDVGMFKYFAKCRDLERRFGVADALDFVVKEDMGVVKFFRQSDNRLIGELKDGIFLLNESMDGGKLGSNSMLKQTLMPNVLYKVKSVDNIRYLYHTDDLGRLTKVETKGTDADKLLPNVVYVREGVDLGPRFTSLLSSVKKSSKGGDVDVTMLLKYADSQTVPLVADINVSVNGKRVISESFENLANTSKRTFTRTDNAKLIDDYAKKGGITANKRGELLNEMSADNELAKLIHADPELNIARWLNTRNKVDKTLLARTAEGRTVPNGKSYAGNVYYFNPHLNSGLKARLERNGVIRLKKFGQLTYDDLIKLDKLYPDGVPFTKEGYPDFSNVATKDKSGKTLHVDIGELSGSSQRDINRANSIYLQKGYKDKGGYTWHHKENSTCLIRVPSAIHQLIDHAGGMSTDALHRAA